MINILEHPTYFIILVAAIITLIMSIVNMVLIDQKRMKEINTKVKAYNKKLMKATKGNDEEELKKLQQDKPAIMQMQQELMKMQMPMFLSMLPFFVVFYLLRNLADGQGWGQWLNFPWGAAFALPLFGREVGWLGWYIICSMPFTTFFRKLLGVQ